MSDDGASSRRIAIWPAALGTAGTVVVAWVAVVWAHANPWVVGPVAVAATTVSLVFATRGRGGGDRERDMDARWTALLGSAAARETLVAVDRLTDPLAIERSITTAMREIAGSARLELLRAPDAPTGTLPSARAADPALVRAAIARGVVRHGGGASPEEEQALRNIPAELVLAVRDGPRVHGLLAIEGRVRPAALLQLRRFVDLLAAKLEVHRLWAELAHREQLAALGALVSSLAHDLRTPLSSVALSLQMLARRRAALGDDADLLEIAGDEVRRLEGWLGELVDFAKPVELQARPVDLAAIVESAMRRGRVAAEARGVVLRTELAPQLPAVPGDAARLERVLDNLLSNAISLAPGGSDVTVRARPDGDEVVLEVVDRGPGIAPEDHERIFEPFVSRRPGGTGLGLAIVRRIVTAHRGRIEVESAMGRGARMKVRLPARPAP